MIPDAANLLASIILWFVLVWAVVLILALLLIPKK